MRSTIIKILVWIGVTLLILLLIYNIISNYNFGGSKIPANVFTIIKEPLFGGILGVILSIFILDRYKRIENDISSLQKEQLDTLGKIRDDAENIIKGRLESTTRKANAIESKISGLLEEHPWISSITEHDLIPDASSCRIVLRTCQHLVNINRLPLLYEYLYGWIDKKKSTGDSKSVQLNGTIDDFLDLADYCERVLGDEYLALQITKEGVTNASNRNYGYPDYLNRLVRYGSYDEAHSITKYIHRQIPIILNIGDTPFIWQPNKSMRAKYLFNCFCSLILFYSLANKTTKVDLYKRIAKIYSEKLESQELLKTFEAEGLSIMGEYQLAREMLGEIAILTLDELPKHSEIASKEIIYNSARIYRSIQDSVNFTRLMRILSGEKNGGIDFEDGDFGKDNIGISNSEKALQNENLGNDLKVESNTHQNINDKLDNSLDK